MATSGLAQARPSRPTVVERRENTQNRDEISKDSQHRPAYLPSSAASEVTALAPFLHSLLAMTHRTPLNDCRPPPRSAARRQARRWLGCALALTLGCSSDDDSPGESTEAASGTFASWAASPQDYAEDLPFPGAPLPEPLAFDNQTLRQVVHLSAGGDALRVQLSNLFGTGSVSFDAAGVAFSQGGAAIDPGSHVPLTFGGVPQLTLQPGEERWSDLVSLSIPNEANLAVSVHLGTGPVGNVHALGQQTAYLAPGNVVSAATLPAGETQQSYYWLSRIDVGGAAAPQVIVAFGDSITDGFASSVDENHRYPNYLSARLTAATQPPEYSVVNAGISGNRVLTDVIGPSGVSRFRRDALGQTGVTDVILLLGINDIGFSGFSPEQEVSAEQITGGLAEMIDAANAAQVRVHVGTLLPFEGTMAPYYSEAGEAKRQAVNAWVRANADIASVVDFELLLQDPSNPAAMLPAYDSGDHLHPNDDGYAAMAGAVDVAAFQ